MRDPIRQAERLLATRLRYTINTNYEDRAITTSAAISAAIGLPAAEAISLINRRQWRAEDMPFFKPWQGGSSSTSWRRIPTSCGGRSEPVMAPKALSDLRWQLARPSGCASPVGFTGCCCPSPAVTQAP